MPNAAPFDLHQHLQARHAAIAERWYRAIAWTGFSTRSGDEMRQRLGEWLEQLEHLLLHDPIDRAQARIIGSGLAQIHYEAQPETLGRTIEILSECLMDGVPIDQMLVVQSRLTALLGAIATGFVRQARDQILTQQEEIRHALTKAEQQLEETRRQHTDAIAGQGDDSSTVPAERKPT
jgi:hypothetical protein